MDEKTSSQFTDTALFPPITNLSKSDTNEVIISQIVKLSPNSPQNRYDRSSYIILKEFIYDTIQPERRKFQLEELQKVYFHIPLALYDPEPFDYEFKNRLNLPDRWSYTVTDLETVTFQAFRLSTAPGCPHRVSGCTLRCETCKSFFGCKFCHNELELNHEFPYLETSRVKCRFCQFEQNFSLHCEQCGVEFGSPNSSCLTCKRLDFQDQNTQPFVHCDRCQKCYIGLRNEISHCENCEICFKGASHKRHICNSELTCNACLGPIKNQHLAYTVPPCGHVIHDSCKMQIIGTGCYTCPICRKLIVEDETRFLLLQHQLRVFCWYYFVNWARSSSVFQCNECGQVFRQKLVGINFCRGCGTCNVMQGGGGDQCEGDGLGKIANFDYSRNQIIVMFVNAFWGKKYEFYDEFCVENGICNVEFQGLFQLFVKENQFDKVKNLTFSEVIDIFAKK